MDSHSDIVEIKFYSILNMISKQFINFCLQNSSVDIIEIDFSVILILSILEISQVK